MGLSQDHLRVLTMWGLASPRVNNAGHPAVSCNAFCDLVLAVTYHDLHLNIWVTQPVPIQCGRGLHKDMNTRRQESLRAILEAGYHVTLQFFIHLPSWGSKSKFLAVVWIISFNLCQVFLQLLPDSLCAGVQDPPTVTALSSDGTDPLRAPLQIESLPPPRLTCKYF